MKHDAHDERTTEAMHDTADALERSEATLHGVAERSPDEATKHRVHKLADAVTREAKDIQRRANSLLEP